MGFNTEGAMSGAASGASAGSVAGPWGAVIGGVAGGLLGGFGTKKNKAVQRNPTKEYTTALGEKPQNALLAYQERGNDAATNLQMANSQAALGFFPQMQASQNDATSAARAAGLADLQAYGAGYMDTLKAISPEWAASQNALQYQIENAGQQSELNRALNDSALSQLALGGGLSDQQARDATQAARMGMASRGMALGNGALASEILSRDSYANQLQQQRQQFGLNVEGLNQQGNQADRSFLLNAGSSSLNPFLSLYGQQQGVGVNNAFAAVNPQFGISTANQQASGALDYFGNVYNWNANAKSGTNIANTNMQNNMTGGALNALGGAFAAYGQTQGQNGQYGGLGGGSTGGNSFTVPLSFSGK